jgi:hypothetical protein
MGGFLYPGRRPLRDFRAVAPEAGFENRFRICTPVFPEVRCAPVLRVAD